MGGSPDSDSQSKMTDDEDRIVSELATDAMEAWSKGEEFDVESAVQQFREPIRDEARGIIEAGSLLVSGVQAFVEDGATDKLGELLNRGSVDDLAPNSTEETRIVARLTEELSDSIQSGKPIAPEELLSKVPDQPGVDKTAIRESIEALCLLYLEYGSENQDSGDGFEDDPFSSNPRWN